MFRCMIDFLAGGLDRVRVEYKSSQFAFSFGPSDALDKISIDQRLRDLESRMEVYADGDRWPYDGIWELHFALGRIGIAWPGPGIDPALRRRVSQILLAASRDGNMEDAKMAWAKAMAPHA